MGTVIGGLYLPRFETADLGQAANRGILGGAQLIQGQTNLLQLAELERAQRTAEAARQWEMQNPGLAMGQSQGPQSYLGGAGMPQGPLTQQTTMPGQPPGPAQMVPGGQDLSQFATQGAPGQSPMGQPGPPQDPMMALFRTNPDAARLVQDRMLKMQEGTLKRDIQKFEYVGRILQGVTDQASLQDAHKEIGRAYPDLVGKLPQTYSKEALEPLITRAFDVTERAKLGVQELNARTQAGTLGLAARKAAETVPNYLGDPIVDGIIYTKMKGQPPGTRPSEEIIAASIHEAQATQLQRSREQGAAQEAQKPLGETQMLRFNTLTQAEDTIKKLTTEFTPEERAQFVGLGGITMGQEQLKQLAADAGYGKADPKFARFAALVALAKAEAFSTAGKALTKTEEGVVYGYIPVGTEYSAEEFEQKLKLAQERLPSMLDRELKLATTPRSELQGMRQRGELGASTSQGTLKSVSELNVEETKAEIAALRARGGSQ